MFAFENASAASPAPVEPSPAAGKVYKISASRCAPRWVTGWSLPPYWYRVTRRGDDRVVLGYVAKQGGQWIARRADGTVPWYPQDGVNYYATRAAAASLLVLDREENRSCVLRVTDATFPDGTVADVYAFVDEDSNARAVDFAEATHLQTVQGWPFDAVGTLYPADFASWVAPTFPASRAMRTI